MNRLQVSKSIKKKIWLFILNLLLVLLAIPPALTLLFTSPMVQTISAKLATHVLTQTLQQRLEVQRIQLSLFTGISIKGLKLKDYKGNVLIGVDNLTTMPAFADLLNHKLYLRTAILEGGVFNMGSYQGDTTTNLNTFVASVTPERSRTTSTQRSGPSFKLSIGHVRLINSHFRLFDEENMTNKEKSMDYANITVDSIQMDLSHFSIVDDSLHFFVNSLSGIEKSGIKIDQLTTDFYVSSKGLIANEAVIRMGKSTINADIGLHTKSYRTYSSYIDSVVMTGNFRPTIIDLDDIGYFSEIMYQMPNELGVLGYVEGTVSDLKGKGLRIKFGANTRVSGNFAIKGLPDFFTSYMEADSFSLHTTTGDLRSFRLPIEEKHVDMTDVYAKNSPIILHGDFMGYYEDFKTNLAITTREGTVMTTIALKYIENDTIAFNLSLKGDTVNVGKLIKNEDLIGRASFNLKARGAGRNMNQLWVSSSGTLNNIRLLDYQYKRLKYEMTYVNDSISGTMRVGDHNLMMDATAHVSNLSDPTIDLTAIVAKADFKGLKLIESPEMIVSTSVNAHTHGMNLDTIVARVKLSNTHILHEKKEYVVDSLVLDKSYDSQGNSLLQLTSEIADFSAHGKYQLTTVGSSMVHFLYNYYDFSHHADTAIYGRDEFVELQGNIKKPAMLEDLFYEGISLAPNTSFMGNISLIHDSVYLQAYSPRIEFQGIKIDSNVVIVKNKKHKLFAQYSTPRIVLKDSTPDDQTVFGLDDMSINARVGKDSIIYGVYWNNRDTLLRNTGVVEGYAATFNDTTLFNIGKAKVYINDSVWNIDTNNLIISTPNSLQFQDFYVRGGSSLLKIKGKVPREDNDSLIAEFDKWNLSNFDILTRQSAVDLDGYIDGSLQLSRIKDNPTLVSNLTITDLAFNGEYLGKARLLNTWDNTTNAVFLKTQIIREGNSGIGEVFSADGYYYPFKEDDNLSVKIGFNRIKLKAFEPFLSDFVSQIEGSTSGNLTVSGSVQEPVVEGSAKLQRTSMIVKYLNTRYSFSNSIDFTKTGVGFNNLVLYDTLGNRADIKGELHHDYFKNARFNVEVNTDKLLFFNTTRQMNDLYYGTAIASGKILLKGSPDNIFLDITTATRKGTFVTLPLSYSVEISDKDYIIFVNTADSLVEEKVATNVEKEMANQSKFDIKINLGVTPEAAVVINLPSDMGNIEARGSGDLYMEANSDGDFNLAGDYIVDNGTFLFTIGNVVNKRFTLVKGGRISWTGSPYTANVNIQGLYRVKTNLQSLGVVVDTTAGYKNKVTVNCYIVLTNELLNPDIKFRITIPDLDPDVQRQVFAELDTTNAAMMNQQMISLLVLGTFSFNNASNINLAGSYYGIIANQLSNMLSQISDAFDIGVNYKPGDAVSQQEFEVALSTQLFDDRLTIDGNFGMTYDRSQQSASNLVGDINIGYKLTPDGRWVLKVFNHSNVNSWYNSSNYDQISPYTQGVGIAFRKEFNNISEFFINSRKRERLKQEEKKKNQLPVTPQK